MHANDVDEVGVVGEEGGEGVEVGGGEGRAEGGEGGVDAGFVGGRKLAGGLSEGGE